MNKDCTVCVYDGVCKGRQKDPDITDCCIPEAPLRELQQKAVDVEMFIFQTNKYIREHKLKSEYWKKELE